MQKLLKLFKLKSEGPSNFENWLLVVQSFLVTALIIVIPLFPKFPAFRIEGTYVAIRLEDFLILATLLAFSLPVIKNIKIIFGDKTIRSIFLFLVIGLISLVTGIYLTQTLPSKIGLLHWARRAEYMSLFVVGLMYIKLLIDSKKEKASYFFEYLLKLMVVVNLIIFLYGIGQRYFNLPVIITQNEEYSKGVALRWTPGAHINSTFAGHYDLASYLVLTIPIFVSAFFYYKDKASKIILGLSITFGFWLFSVAVSRISIAAFLIATTISLFLLKKYKEIVVVVAISLIAFGFSPDLRARYERIFDVVRQRLSTLIVVSADEGNVNEDRSTSIRFNVEWPRAMRAFYKNPLLGTGYSSITLATDNDYLRALGETGLLGLLSFILIFINLFKSLFNFKFSNIFEGDGLFSVFVSCAIGSLVGILTTSIFIDIFEASKFALIFWLLIGIVVGKLVNKQYA